MPDQLFFDIVKMVVALACVIGLVYLVVYVLKRVAPGTARAQGAKVEMQVLAQLSVGQRQRICVVRVQDQTLVVGITEGSINTLAELSPHRSEARAEARKEADDPKIFAHLLPPRKEHAAAAQRAGKPVHPADDFNIAPLGGRRHDAPYEPADTGDLPPLFAPGERPAR